MTAIDAEARHEIEMFVSGEQDSEGLDGWWFVTNPPLTGPCMDIWVTLTSMSFFGVTEREARERLSAIYYGPSRPSGTRTTTGTSGGSDERPYRAVCPARPRGHAVP